MQNLNEDMVCSYKMIIIQTYDVFINGLPVSQYVPL